MDGYNALQTKSDLYSRNEKQYSIDSMDKDQLMLVILMARSQ